MGAVSIHLIGIPLLPLPLHLHSVTVNKKAVNKSPPYVFIPSCPTFSLRTGVRLAGGPG